MSVCILVVQAGICLSLSSALGIWNSRWMNAIRCNMLKLNVNTSPFIALALFCCHVLVCLNELISFWTWTTEFASLRRNQLLFFFLSCLRYQQQSYAICGWKNKNCSNISESCCPFNIGELLCVFPETWTQRRGFDWTDPSLSETKDKGAEREELMHEPVIFCRFSDSPET